MMRLLMLFPLVLCAACAPGTYSSADRDICTELAFEIRDNLGDVSVFINPDLGVKTGNTDQMSEGTSSLPINGTLSIPLKN